MRESATIWGRVVSSPPDVLMIGSLAQKHYDGSGNLLAAKINVQRSANRSCPQVELDFVTCLWGTGKASLVN